nr:hypothetical protein [Tanacetum cinerariifolium]
MPIEPSGHAESPSLDEEVPEINAGDQYKGQARPNPGEHNEGQTGSNPGDAFSDDEDTRNDQLPKVNTRKDWWKTLPKEERPATLEPAWTIPSSNMLDVEKNWATALSLTYATPAENSLLSKTGDIMTFMNWYCRKVNKTVLTQADFKGQAYEVVKAFYPDVIHLQFQMEECHKLITDQIDWANLGGDQVKIDVTQPLPLGGPLSHVTIQTQFIFNKDLEYLRYSNKRSRPVLSISKIKAAHYHDFGLELLVPEQLWIDDVCTYDISAKYGISHWWLIEKSSILTDMILRRIKKKSEHTCRFLVSSTSKSTQDTGMIT